MRKDWPETPHLQELIERPVGPKELIVGFVTSDGVERAVWDNGCYYEAFRYGTETGWTADTIENAEEWPEEANELYGEACLHLGEVGERGKPAALEPVQVCMGCSTELRDGKCPNLACTWGKAPDLQINYDSDNYMAFSLRPREDASPEQVAQFEAIEEQEAQRWVAAKTPEEWSEAEDLSVLGSTLDWGVTASEMAANMRRTADWLASVSERFPYCEITVNID